ncbi:MAG TPA: hypothetical protein GX743_05000 [Actinomycetales bacterium]|nr:hypothetical protein [Actinomycetales bacterium]
MNQSTPQQPRPQQPPGQQQPPGGPPHTSQPYQQYPQGQPYQQGQQYEQGQQYPQPQPYPPQAQPQPGPGYPQRQQAQQHQPIQSAQPYPQQAQPYPQPQPQFYGPPGQLSPAPQAHGAGSRPVAERIPKVGAIIAIVGAVLSFVSMFLTLVELPQGSVTYQALADLLRGEMGMFTGLSTAMLYLGPVLVVVGALMAILVARLHLVGSILTGVGASAISFATMNWFIWLAAAGVTTEFGPGAWLLLLGFVLVVAGIIGLAFKKY